MMRARWSQRLYRAVSAVVLCSLILPPGLAGAIALPAVLTATDSPAETLPLTVMASLTETTPLEETTPVTPTDVITPPEEVAEPVMPIAEPVLPTFESPLLTPPAPASGPELLLTVQGGEEAVQPGDAVALTVTVANTGDAPARGVFVEAALPESLQLTDQQRGWEYDQRAGRLSVQVGDLEPGAQVTLDLELRAKGPLDTLAEVAFEAHTGPAATNADGTQDTTATATTATAMTTILVAHPRTAVVERGGGRIASEDGRVWVDFPPGALDQTREITVRAARREATADVEPTGTLLRFSLEPDMQFSTPVTLTLDLSDLTDWERALSDGRVFLNTWDEAQGRWIELPCDFDPDTRLLTARLEHFTNYGAGVDGVKGWQLLFRPVETALFSGAMTYNYPMEVLPGRAGLQPQVNLGYSSRAVDGVIGWVQSDWTGLGWSIDQVDITRIIKHPEDVSRLYQQSEQLETMCRNYYDLCHVNEFNLLINGASYHLVPVNPLQKGGRYYAEGAPALWVYRYNGYAAPESPSNVTGEWWQVKTADGKTYRLGYTTNSEQVVDNIYSYSARAKTDGVMGWFPWDYEWLYAGRAQGDGEGDDWGGTVAYRWRVDAVADTDGNTVTYSYFEEKATSQCSYMPPNWDRASYLSQIQYGNATIVFDLGLRHESGIADGIGAAGYCDRRQFFQARYLRKVRVLWGGQLVREYRLGYTQETGDGRTLPTRLLQSIALYEPGGTSLPATTFAYVKLNNQDHFCNWADGCYPDVDGRPQFPYPRVAQVNNGYAGNVHVQYDGGGQIGRAKYARYYYWVKQRTVMPGIGVAGVTTYEFDNRCFRNGENYWNRGCSSDRTAGDFVGWGWAKERYKGDDGVTDVSIVEHTFRLSDSNGMNWLLNGREEQTSYRNGSNTLLRRVDRVWTLDSASGGWARLDQEVSTDYYGGAPVASQKTAYEYAPGAQGNAQYGNITAIYQYGAVDPATRENTAAYQGDERSIHRAYYPNTEKWIVSAIAWENIHEGITPNVPGPQLKTQTINYYDYATAYSTPPTLGHLTKVQRGLSGGPWAITTYIYDTWGNVTSVTDPNTNTSTITYDTTYRMFPLLNCSPYIANVGQLCTTTEYYGVGGIAADYGLPGQVKRVWDANGVATANEYRYDAFGRLVRVRMPGDAGWEDNQVSRLYKYVSDGLIGRQRIISYQGQGNILWQETYYDGLGRTIQVHQKADNGQEVRTTTQYNALGQAVKTWVPYYGVHGEEGGYGVNGYVPASTSLPHSVTQYDALGRVTQVTAPDGTASRTLYNGWQTTAIDANNHQRISTVDAYGQLVQVQEYTSTYPSALLYATTRYAYNILGNLTTVTDTLNNVTTMMYDALGRKTAMNDRDMGQWAYTYDNAGNLKTQTDARGCMTNFAYDPLNRLIGKSYGGVCGSTDSIIYTYDDALLRYDAFDGSALPTGWAQGGTVTVSGGQAHLTGNGNWDTNVRRTGTVGDGQSVRFSFRLNTTTAIGAIFLHSGAWGQADYRRWGLMIVGGKIYRHIYEGTSDNLVQLLTLQANVWYEGVLKIGGTNEFVAEIWERDNLSARARRAESRSTWSGRSWAFMSQMYSGIQNLDYYAELQAQAGSKGRRTVMGDSSGSATWAYDNRGRVVTETKTINGGGTFTTGYTYDSIDRVVTTTYPDGEVVRSTYNAAGQPATLRSDTYSYNYVSSASYAAPGSMLTMVYGNNLTNNYDYYDTAAEIDPGTNRAYSFRLRRAWVNNDLFDLNYQYDGVGNVKTIADYSGNTNETQTFTYDPLDRLSGVTGAYVATYTYNAIGNLITNNGATYTYPDSGNASVRPHAVTGVTSKGWSFGYDANGNMLTRTLGSTTYLLTYTAENKLATATGANGTFSYTYDGDGKLVMKTTPDGTTRYVGPHYEVGPAKITLPATPLKYGVACQDKATGSGYLMYSAESVHTRFAANPPNSNNAAHFICVKYGLGWQYDNDNGDYTFTPRDTDILVAAVDFSADTVTDLKGQNTTLFGISQGYAAGNLTFQANRWNGAYNLGEFSIGGDWFTTNAQSTVTKSYFFGSQRMAMRQGTLLTYLHGDHLGSASLSTDASGGKTAEMRYYPYGERRNGAIFTDRRYTGQREEAGLSLYDYNARYYDPYLNRFISPDSIIPDPANPQSLNRFSYTLNNPLRYKDPSGHDVGCPGQDLSACKPARKPRSSPTATVSPTPQRQPTPVPVYNRRNAANYALNWHVKNNPEYPAMSNGSDCTNFASQCLLAGGLRPDARWYYAGENSPNAWRYTRTDPSNVGSECPYGQCDGLYNYLTDASGRGFAAAEYHSQEFSADDPTQPGDIVFYLQDSPDTPDMYDPMWTHAAVVVGWGPKNPEDLSSFLTTNGGEFVSYNQGGGLTLWIAEHSASAEGLRPVYRTRNPVIQLDIVYIGVH